MLPDVPARNGAVHVVSKLLNPVKRPHHPPPHPPPKKGEGEAHAGAVAEEEHEDGEWAGWEEWLLQWAAEN